MPAYNFQARFAPAVEARRKLHTVRRRRRHATKPGDLFVGYTGQRTAKCRELVRGVVTRVEPLEIHEDGAWYVGARERWTPEQIAAFVAADTDGLMTPVDFLGFIAENYGLPADDLEIVYWRPEGED